MATTPSFVQVNEGTGKKLAAVTYTENGQVVYDSKVVLGEIYLATYSVTTAPVAMSTANSHLLQIMAGASLNVRIRRIHIDQFNGATAAANREIQLLRLTTAGTGGTVVTPSKYDTSDAAAGATAMTLPTVKGSESVELWQENVVAYQGLLTTAAQVPDHFDWVQTPGDKPIIIPAGAANGIAFKNTGSDATATWNIKVEFIETSF